MKKLFLFMSWVMLILSSCADEDIIERNSPSFPQSVNTRSAGDGVYDILGYGYDITGPYLDTKSSRAIVFDTNKLLEKGLITPYKLEESRFRYSSGKDVIDFTTNMSSSLQMSTPGILKVIGGASLNIAFGGNSHYNSDYSFAYCTQQYIDSRYRISEADINVLKTCLTKQFIERLSTYTPEQIVEEYGTHVLKDIYLGAKFEVYYMAKSTSSSKKESINAGLGASLFSLFKMDGKFQYDESLAITNKEQSLYYFTIGGDPAVGVQGSLNPENSPSIDIGKWMASVKSSTPKFIDVDNNSQSFIPIYELVTDPTKKQTLKAYIDNYIKSKEVCSISLYPSTTGTRQVSGLGHINQGAGVAIGDIDKNGRPDMILMGIDNPKGKNNFWYKVLYDIDENGYYSKESSILSISAEGWENSGGDIALCDLNNNGILDMVLLCTDKPTTAGRAYRWYYVAYDLKPDGHYNSLSSLNTNRELGFFYDGAGIDICDINKNGTPDLLMMVYDAPEGENSFRYQIAFDLQSNGNYLSLSPVYEVPGLGHDGDGAGVAVGDIDNNGTLDILFMALDAPSGKDKFVYEILPDIDKYGNSYAKPIYTPRFPDSLSPCDTGQGAACSLYDLDNNGFLDAIFVAIENIKGKSNSWKYVTGHNLNKQGVPMCWR
ncbi:MAG: MAC/perforin domain-containing protein [Bacteroides sp.]|uniref:MAC/perforin domain-containing protein n=1 Tax=Bacteroides sp. TaxID=29523 RepID=UPI0029143932|nr:MAC/perforin domain-containing protein [Bacteroides sp.]MDU6477476.1 MAC/perforin domain-containing protein [Bacteroides sp.]